MNINYKEIVDKYTPKENKLFNCFISFFSGGLIGLISQFLTVFYSNFFEITMKDASSIMIITLILFASLFTALGFFDSWVDVCKCGLIIPITGFAHSVTSSILEYKNEGLIFGFGSNLFKLAGSVILYGIVFSFLIALLRILGGYIIEYYF